MDRSNIDVKGGWYLKFSEVLAFTGLSRRTIDRLESVGKFPKRIRISPGRVAWLISDLETWKERVTNQGQTQ